MCYSAMVQQNAKKIGLRFQARVQYDMYEDLMARRLAGEKITVNKAFETQFTLKPESAEIRKIAKLISDWHKEQIPEIEKQIFAQKKRLADALRSLEKKTTKKAEEDKRIATKKIEKFKQDLEWHRSTNVESESDERIFPSHYMSMLCLDEKGQKVVRPVRYLLRPNNKDETFDRKFGGCYNARLDSLDTVPWWRDALGRRHGLILVTKFYENVPVQRYLKNHKLPDNLQERDNIVLSFAPDNVEYMFIPTLWDVWKKKGASPLYSAALITDEPAPEIAAAGHDRTPIFLKESAVEDWLKAPETSLKDLAYVLNQRERPHYSHALMDVA